MKQLLTGKQMKEADTYSISEFGMESLVLMERAAMAVTEHILSGRTPGRVFLLCGMGNNGADGLAAARMLHQKGWIVYILAIGNRKKATKEWDYQKKLLDKMNINVTVVPTPGPEMDEKTVYDSIEAYYPKADVYVDALFGVGLSRSVEGIYKAAIEKWNSHKESCGAYGVAVDICSGIDAANGKILGACIRADAQITFGYAKLGQFLYPAAAAVKETIVSDIGFPKEASENVSGIIVQALEKKDAALWLKERCPWGNKKTFGRILIIAGSYGMAGAAYMSAMAAYRMGAGLVDIVTPDSNREIIQQLIPEAVLHCIPKACMAYDELDKWLSGLLESSDVVVIGPGLSQDKTAENMFDIVLEYDNKKDISNKIPIVIDADALNILAKKKEIQDIRRFESNVIMTPHPGEMSRLLKTDIKSIVGDFMHYANKLQKEYGGVCVCKDARTLIYTSDENLKEKIFINLTGNCGMAVGGSGDILTGIIAALAAQKTQACKAAVLGVWIHGAAGDEAAKKQSRYSMTARDLLSAIAKVLKQISGKKV